MIPVLVAVVVGATIGTLRRPHGTHLAPPRLAFPAIGVVGAAAHLAIGLLDPDLQGIALSLSLALLCAFAIANAGSARIAGMGVLAVGLVANLAGVAVHGSMPVSAEALVEAGVVAPDDLVDHDPGAGRRFERDTDLLPVLGDVVPVRPFRAAMSFGDLIVLVGVAAMANDLVRHARRGRRSALDVVRGLEPERGRQLRVGGEAVGVPEHVEDVEELATVLDPVEPEDRLRDQGGGEGHGGERPRITSSR
jgi:hypothetical protein